MNYRYLYIILASIASLITLEGCDADLYIDTDEQLVVEGWIDSDDFPVVILTKTIVVKNEEEKINDLQNHVIRNARVTVVCDGDSVILTGKYNDNYYPPYIYTTSRMRGIAGQRYDLIVGHDDQLLTSSTVIPSPAHIDSCCVTPVSVSDKTYNIRIFFRDDPTTTDYYKIFSASATSKAMFTSSLLQTMQDTDLDEENQAYVYRRNTIIQNDDCQYFKEGDFVNVKLCRIDSTAYNFWHTYENSISFSRNPITQFNDNLPSNINGGLGYWFGYGAHTIYIDLQHPQQKDFAD